MHVHVHESRHDPHSRCVNFLLRRKIGGDLFGAQGYHALFDADEELSVDAVGRVDDPAVFYKQLLGAGADDGRENGLAVFFLKHSRRLLRANKVPPCGRPRRWSPGPI